MMIVTRHFDKLAQKQAFGGLIFVFVVSRYLLYDFLSCPPWGTFFEAICALDKSRKKEYDIYKLFVQEKYY